MENANQEAGATKFCDNCKRDITESAFITHENHCRRYIVLCEHCEEPVPKRDLDSHYEEEHSPQPCELCEKTFPKDQLETHKENDCPAFRMECKYCELDVKRQSFQEHIDGCGSRTDHCEVCNQRVMLKDMDEHRQFKCGNTRPEDALDPHTLQHIQDQNGEVSNLMFPTYSPINGFHHHHHHHQLPFWGRTSLDHYQSPPPPYEPPPYEPPSYESHSEASIPVDPQWLASLTDACGGEDLDQVLAQNLMAEDFRHGNVPKGDNLAGQDNYGGVARQQHTEISNFVAPLAPNSPVDFPVIPQSSRREGYTGEYLREGIQFRSEHSLAMNQDKETQEEGDAEMARQIHERDLAYSLINRDDINLPSSEEMDAEMARQIHERDLAYSLRNRDDINRPSSVENDAGMARQMHDKELAYSLGNRSSERDDINLPSSVENDVEIARQISYAYDESHLGQDKLVRDLAYRYEEGEDDESDVNAPSFIGKEERDARQLQEKDLANFLRKKNDAEVTRNGKEERDAEIARQLQERDLANFLSKENDAQATRDAKEEHASEIAIQLQMAYFRRRDNGAETTREIYERYPTYNREREDLERDAPSFVHRESNGAVMVGQIHKGDLIAYSPREERDGDDNDNLLGQTYGREPNKNTSRGDTFTRSRHGIDYRSYGFGDFGALNNEQPRPKTPPPVKADEENVPCQYCSKLYPFDMIMLHQQTCRDDDYDTTVKNSGASSRHELMKDTPYVTAQPLQDREKGDGIVLTDDFLKKISASSARIDFHQTDVMANCKHCNERMAEIMLITHQVMCSANPDIHLKNAFSPSSPTSTSVGRSTYHRHEKPLHGRDGLVTSEESDDNGPCEVCGKLISVKDIVRHESICQLQMRKKTSIPAVPSIRSKPVKRESTTNKRMPQASLENKRGLAIKFPPLAGNSNSSLVASTSQRKRTGPDSSELSLVRQYGSSRSTNKELSRDSARQSTSVIRKNKVLVSLNGVHKADKSDKGVAGKGVDVSTRITGQRSIPDKGRISTSGKATGVTGTRTGSSIKMNGTEKFSASSRPREKSPALAVDDSLMIKKVGSIGTPAQGTHHHENRKKERQPQHTHIY